MPGMELKREEMKERIMNYLEYMDSKDMQDIASTLYNISKRRETKNGNPYNYGSRFEISVVIYLI